MLYLAQVFHRHVFIGLAGFVLVMLPHLPVTVAELPHAAEESESSSWWHAFVKAFFVVSVAEVFDKTWFVTLILALKHGRQLAFTASFTGLAVHVVIAALLGFEISKLLRPAVLDFSAAALFAMFALLYFKDFLYADVDSDMIKAGKDEAEEGLENQPVQADNKSYGGTAPVFQGKVRLEQDKTITSIFFTAFMTVFIAEWGDRTQIAMVGLHSSLPVMPVFWGSMLAFGVLSLSAVLIAAVVEQQQLSERLVMGIVSASFAVFAVMSFRDGLHASRAEQ